MTGLMIVDDEEGVRRSLKKVFEKECSDIVLAENGRQAIDMVKTHRPDIETVISDFKMPGIDGLETLIEIGRINPDITRIMLTGYATMESAIDSVNEGIDGFLTKPFDNLEIRAKVREYNLKKRLKQFVSEQILMTLQKDGASMMPQRHIVSILFTDIRGFTALSETLAPDELSDFLNVYYFSPLDRIIFDCNGTLDKHIGDSIMAVFGAPVGYADDAHRAVTSAIKMKQEIAAINERLRPMNRNLSVGMGVSTGEVMAGIFGSSRKKEYTAFGSAVNVAARLEKKAAAGQILICPETYRRVAESFEVRKTDVASLRGIERKLDIYEVVGAK